MATCSSRKTPKVLFRSYEASASLVAPPEMVDAPGVRFDEPAPLRSKVLLTHWTPSDVRVATEVNGLYEAVEIALAVPNRVGAYRAFPLFACHCRPHCVVGTELLR